MASSDQFDVPQRCDDLPKFFWDADSIAIGVSVLMLGLMANQFVAGAVLAVVVGKYYQSEKDKSGGHQGHFKAVISWVLPGFMLRVKAVPKSDIRFFKG